MNNLILICIGYWLFGLSYIFLRKGKTSRLEALVGSYVDRIIHPKFLLLAMAYSYFFILVTGLIAGDEINQMIVIPTIDWLTK